jgi:translation initiation factor 2B subunit (eIF-2B alpha/beta/delta family)
VSFQWFDLDDLADEASFQGVPRLYESLRRVWFDFDLGREAASPLRTGLLALQQDRTRTASQLASLALAVFIEVISKMDTRHSREAWWRNARMAAWHIWKNGRESTTAPILHVVLNSLVIVETLLPAKAPAEELPSDFSEDVAPSVRDYARQRTDSEDRIFEMFVSFLDVTFPTNEELNILTLSFSSTVLSCIEDTLDLEHQRRMGRKLHIHVLESRPLFEGVRMAKSIASYSEKLKLETNISVHTDASVAHAAQGVDLVLLGADAIAQNGDIFNKTGSLPAILAARHVSPVAKIVVLSDKEKITPFSDPFHEEHSPKELLQAWGDLGPEGGQYQSDAGVKFSVNNTRIERVPSSFIDYYVMEDGFRTSNDMPGLAERVEKAAERYFSDLGNCE